MPTPRDCGNQFTQYNFLCISSKNIKDNRWLYYFFKTLSSAFIFLNFYIKTKQFPLCNLTTDIYNGNYSIYFLSHMHTSSHI